MRGQQERSGSLFSYVSFEERIPASHPLRRIRKLADQALDRLNPTFSELYASEGRPSVPPEQLLLASLLQAFYGIRSERLLLEQLHYSLLFRWFVGLSPGDFQGRCHSLAATQATRINCSARIGSGSSNGLLIHTSSG
jgi:transposase